MALQLNEKWLHIGKIPVPTNFPCENGGTVQVKVVGVDNVYHLECTKVETPNNQDGTEDLVYKLKYQPHEF